MSLDGLFITGTDTSVRVGAYKPAASGSRPGPQGPVWDDAVRLQAALGGGVPVARICPQRFHPPLAPPVAARQEGKVVDAELLRTGIDWWRGRVEFVIVEGAGGLLSPLTESETVADLAVSFGFPLLIVARLSLGTINHTLLTLEAARSRGLAVAGVVLNQPITADARDCSLQSNAAELEKRCGAPILAILPHAPAAGLIQHSPLFTIDWSGFTSKRNSVR
jgi:dethiobiotin synthetase